MTSGPPDLELMTFPPLLRAEAQRAMRRIYYCFAGIAGKANKAALMERSISRVWISGSESSTSGAQFGWGRMIRDCAYTIFALTYPGFNAAEAVSAGPKQRERAIARILERAQLELDILQHVIDRGYLSGSLRPKPKVTTIEAKRARVQANLRRWQTKQKRATNAIKKLQRMLRRLDRKEAEARIQQEAKLL